MRRSLASTLILGALALTACGDDSGGTSKDAAVSIDGNRVIDGSSAIDAKPIDAARPDSGPIDAAGMVMPAPTDAGAGQVGCGSMTCNTATQECCVTNVGMAVMTTCVNKGTCAGPGTAACDGPEDCNASANQVCCGHFMTAGGAGAGMASCKTYGPNPGECSGDYRFDLASMSASGDVVLCHTPHQTSAECPSDKRICQQCMQNGQPFTFCTATPLPTFGGFCMTPPP